MIAALGISGSVTLLAFLAFSWWHAKQLRDSEHRWGEQKARGDALDVNLTGIAAQLSDVTTKHQEVKARADRMSKALSKLVALIAARPVDGSARVLLQEIAAASAAEGDHGDGDVPVRSGADAGGDTELLRPGAD